MYLGYTWINLVFMLQLFMICLTITIMLCIFYVFYLYYHSKGEIYKKYILNNEEKNLWGSIINKAQSGYHEWNTKEDKYDYLSPWMSPHLTKEEQKLIDKIHEYYYPGDYIIWPIGAAQADYVWYSDIIK